MTDPGDVQQVSFNWSPKNLEIKTRTVERTLEPLVMQVNKFISYSKYKLCANCFHLWEIVYTEDVLFRSLPLSAQSPRRIKKESLREP